ncbi:hypothetical protein TBLA_0G01170 [Henningerozyma blattae CBS 6284]|uniref:Uncharacterized protein n=1 Tax=Henningerozyma blattae (strain ATCC 34711 / CBS 6284 / DSM 70876 / NBRC 10599 / NRRL Y-10934 / UCD 77-7) TaxID=1071380 RepID=I2H6R3_HENB6|nr:hypothetical protein TBLA_0G01170 [Tetrapisispora blattae CBS 6284]CCH62065.1 hypothetical protein TBLA_0G01170 [Tetrapisispora blattae CBS 6284]
MPRKIKVIKKKSHEKKKDPLAQEKLLWTIGHSMMLVLGLIFSITYFYHAILFFKYRDIKWLFLKSKSEYSIVTGTRWFHKLLKWAPQILYRLALVGGVLAYSTTMKQNCKGWSPTWYDLLSSENFQTLMIVLLWLFTFGKSFYRILPLMANSLIHLMNKKYEMTNEVDDKLNSDVARKHSKILKLIAYSEVFLMITLFLDTFLMKYGTAGVSLILYLGIFWLRLIYSPYLQFTVLSILIKMDKVVPKSKKKQWEKLKTFLKENREKREKRQEAYKATA